MNDATGDRPHVDVGPIQLEIIRKLRAAFQPTYLDVINLSHLLHGPGGTESAFKVVVVSDSFDGVPLTTRHRAVHRVLSYELASCVRALILETLTSRQWQERGTDAVESSGLVEPCRVGRPGCGREQL